MAKKRKNGRIWLLLLLIFFAYRYLDVTEENAGPQEGLQGEWHAHGDADDDVEVVIDEDSVRVIDGGRELCDEAYSFDERTQLVTGAYRQDFELFALFEYRSGDEGVNGAPVLIGSALRPDGRTEEIWLSKK